MILFSNLAGPISVISSFWSLSYSKPLEPVPFELGSRKYLEEVSRKTSKVLTSYYPTNSLDCGEFLKKSPESDDAKALSHAYYLV